MSNRLRKITEIVRAVLTGVPSHERRYQRRVASIGAVQPPEFDLVFVLPPPNHQGWILEAICREIDAHCDGRTACVSLGERLPPARAYFYAHYGYMRGVLLQQPEILHGRNLVFFTHPRQLWYSDDELMYVMNMADSVVCMCSRFVPELIEKGLSPERVEVALVGADADRFQPHIRGTGKIGFCSGYVPRKGGHRILEIVRSMPNNSFVLCGKKWPDWNRFDELISMTNFEYIDIPYSEYQDFYNSIDVFVSVSDLEGGPVPLIEAAMCNAVPVCSNTGHAPDIIVHGKNGFLFDPAAPISDIVTLIREAFDCPCDVRSTVEHLTWKRFSHQIQEIAGLPHAETDGSISEAA